MGSRKRGRRQILCPCWHAETSGAPKDGMAVSPGSFSKPLEGRVQSLMLLSQVPTPNTCTLTYSHTHACTQPSVQGRPYEQRVE